MIGLAFEGARPFWFFQRVGGLVLLRPMIKKLIRLHHVQLLSTSAAAGLGSREKRLCPNPGRSARPLRLQRVEPQKESRKAPVHAHESHEARSGRPPEELALEQLLVLLEIQTGFDPYQSRHLSGEQGDGKPNPPTLRKNPKGPAPATSKSLKAWPTRPITFILRIPVEYGTCRGSPNRILTLNVDFLCDTNHIHEFRISGCRTVRNPCLERSLE